MSTAASTVATAPPRRPFDVERVRARLPDPAAAGPRQAARLPRQRRHHAEAAGGDRRASRTTTRDDNANIHRGVHLLSERATARVRGGARDGAALPQRAPTRARSSSRAARPRPSTWSRRAYGAAAASARATRSSSPAWSTTRTSSPGRCSARRRARGCASSRSTDARRAASWTSSSGCSAPRTRLVARRRTSRTRSARSTRSREIVRLAHARGIPVLVDGAQAVPHLPRRRAGARLRLLRLLRPQDVRPDRHRRALRQGGAARGACRPTRAAAT